MPAPKDIEKKMEALREKIRHHEYLYHVLDNPHARPGGNVGGGQIAVATWQKSTARRLVSICAVGEVTDPMLCGLGDTVTVTVTPRPPTP